MRAYELEESAVEELKNRLPKLKVHSYDTIDRLMNHVSAKHKITGKKLHDMFVRKYGHTPDTWIKKITNKLSEEGVAEGSEESYMIIRTDKEGKQDVFAGNFDTYKQAQKELDACLAHPLHTKYKQKFEIKRKVQQGVAEESKGLWANIHAKRERIKHGSGEHMRKPGSKGAPTASALKKSAVEEGEVLPLKRPMSKVQHGKRTFPPTQRDVKEPEGNITPLPQKKSSKIVEGVDGPKDIEKVKHFIKWSYKTLNMQKPYPRITLSKDTKAAQDGHHTGLHKGNDIWVYVANRNLIDIFRTIFHELTHHRQMQLNMIKDGDSYPGSPIEMLADMAAGKYIKIYGKDHPEMFQ
jgi:hypothetical protein